LARRAPGGSGEIEKIKTFKWQAFKKDKQVDFSEK
jgi:hypothetical protein